MRDVIYSADALIDGHGARDELRHMLELTRPKYCCRSTANIGCLWRLIRRWRPSSGIPPEAPIATIGDIWQFDEQAARKLGQAAAGAVLIDGLTIGNVTRTWCCATGSTSPRMASSSPRWRLIAPPGNS